MYKYIYSAWFIYLISRERLTSEWLTRSPISLSLSDFHQYYNPNNPPINSPNIPNIPKKCTLDKLVHFYHVWSGFWLHPELPRVVLPVVSHVHVNTHVHTTHTPSSSGTSVHVNSGVTGPPIAILPGSGLSIGKNHLHQD